MNTFSSEDIYTYTISEGQVKVYKGMMGTVEVVQWYDASTNLLIAQWEDGYRCISCVETKK